MNYIKQVNTFYELLLTKSLSPNSQCLYHCLMHINNRCNWIKEFTVANSLIMGLTGLDKNKLDRARNELVQKKYIKYKSGKNQFQAGVYEITEFDTANDTANDTAFNTADDIATDTAYENINKHKQNKTKKENIKRKFGDYQNVFFTDEQFEKLKLDFPNDYQTRIQKLDDYMASTGKKYKDCLATLRNWARREGYKFPSESQKSEFKVIDTRELTREEYAKIVRGEKDV